ncbi:MAG TPA: YceI family protein [Burkholderiales bacterium]|nr:YceI family protein [Burkholderiales bacterium]
MNNIASLAAGLLLALPAPLFAQGASWKMDPAGSRLEFTATFEKAPAPGVFKEFDTRLRFDPDKPAGGSLDVTIKVTSADMAIPDVNKEIRTKDWFDYSGFPQAEFHSTDLRRDGGRYVARGTLSLKGVKQAVEVPFAWTPTGEGATMEGELTLRRGVFGIGLGEWKATDVIGADVKVKFKVKLRKG